MPRKSTTAEFTSSAIDKHGSTYDYTKIKYINNSTKVDIICQVHGDFEQTAHNHLRGYGCLCCANSSTYSSKAIAWLEGISTKEGLKIQHAESGGEFTIPTTKFKADGYCKLTNTIYEFYGDNWHGNLDIHNPKKNCHPYSDKTAAQLYSETMSREKIIWSLGFNLITMWENDYNE